MKFFSGEIGVQRVCPTLFRPATQTLSGYFEAVVDACERAGILPECVAVTSETDFAHLLGDQGNAVAPVDVVSYMVEASRTIDPAQHFLFHDENAGLELVGGGPALTAIELDKSLECAKYL